MATTNREMENRFVRLIDTLGLAVLIDEFYYYLDSDTLHDFIETTERNFDIDDDEEDEYEEED